MFGRFSYDLHIGYAGRTERVAGELVSGSYFPVLGVRAAAGRRAHAPTMTARRAGIRSRC